MIKKIFFLLLLLCSYKESIALNLLDSRQCVQASSYYEPSFNIPKNLLYAISLVESGRFDSNTKKAVPWPWTVGVKGKPYYFNTKNEALEFITDTINQGILNIDIGCHQINWMYHGHNFESYEQILNPMINAQYAAWFLNNKYQESKDWIEAIGHYHSYTKDLAENYKRKVKLAWQVERNHRGLYKADRPKYSNPYYARKYVSINGQANEGVRMITKRVLKH